MPLMVFFYLLWRRRQEPFSIRGSLSMRGQSVNDQQRKKNDQHRIVKFIADHLPDVVVLGAVNVPCSRLKEDTYEFLENWQAILSAHLLLPRLLPATMRNKVQRKCKMRGYTLKVEALNEILSFLSNYEDAEDEALDLLLDELQHQSWDAGAHYWMYNLLGVQGLIADKIGRLMVVDFCSQDIACDTFLKIVQKCKRKFVMVQVGHMIQAESEASKRDEYLQRLMNLPSSKQSLCIVSYDKFYMCKNGSIVAQTVVLFKELRLTLHSILKELIRKPQGLIWKTFLQINFCNKLGVFTEKVILLLQEHVYSLSVYEKAATCISMDLAYVYEPLDELRQMYEELPILFGGAVSSHWEQCPTSVF
ncbi:hypothetical protein L6452_07348 [Arctium lappa]|uniref:Uncharacterized protein n=1 Tax=Arctium lappa TaxID=4217 RepID=A0ACB9ELG8_ARCLA|nr:hypothetical protein L6452_07348 [Arctium lappa]